jgi:cell division topological specificity factor
MSNWFERLLGRGPVTSAQSAKERLQFVLIHDRTDLSPAVLETLKDEIIGVISKHVEIDIPGVEINFSRDQRINRLIANIPLLTANGRKRRRQ